jgi:cullin-associated NEDD8-dissociated protein 1
LGQLIKIIRETQMELVVDSLISFSMGKDDELRDISGLGRDLKTVRELYKLIANIQH